MANQHQPGPSSPGTIEPTETAHAGGDPVHEEALSRLRVVEVGRCGGGGGVEVAAVAEDATGRGGEVGAGRGAARLERPPRDATGSSRTSFPSTLPRS